MSIPRIIHQIWLGPQPLPEKFGPYIESWKTHHPQWEHRLWRDGDIAALLPDLVCRTAFGPSQNPALLSDLLRAELVFRFGGVYVDCDFECLGPFLDWALVDGCFHYGDQSQGCPGNAFLAAPVAHPFVATLLYKLARSVSGVTVDGWEGVRDRIYHLTGPGRLASVLGFYVEHWGNPETLYRKENGVSYANLYSPDVVAFLVEALHPYFYTEAWKPEAYPNALAAHHWAGSWFSS